MFRFCSQSNLRFGPLGGARSSVLRLRGRDREGEYRVGVSSPPQPSPVRGGGCAQNLPTLASHTSSHHSRTSRSMADMTIKEIRTTILRVPWPETPWLKGHAFGDARNLLVLEVETRGGIVGMGYLFSFRPGLRTI